MTSRFTMDSKDSSARKYMAERADLLGAIRLPNNAFKANASTEVVSDILFLQKRDRPADIEPAWVQLGQTEDGFNINQYFVDHPEMVLGNLELESTQYGHDLTVAPIEDANLADQLTEAVQHIEGQYTAVEIAAPDVADAEVQRKTLPADPTVKNFSYTVVDGEIYYPVSLGDDARGNITRLDNAIDNFTDRIADAENALQNLEQQKQAAEVEVAKTFAQEEELAEKSARLAELNALLNIDRDRSSSQDAPEETEETETPATRPSVLAALGEKTHQPEPVKPFRSYYDKDGDAR